MEAYVASFVVAVAAGTVVWWITQRRRGNRSDTRIADNTTREKSQIIVRTETDAPGPHNSTIERNDVGKSAGIEDSVKIRRRRSR